MYLTHLDPVDTERIMTERLSVSADPNGTWRVRCALMCLTSVFLFSAHLHGRSTWLSYPGAEHSLLGHRLNQWHHGSRGREAIPCYRYQGLSFGADSFMLVCPWRVTGKFLSEAGVHCSCFWPFMRALKLPGPVEPV